MGARYGGQKKGKGRKRNHTGGRGESNAGKSGGGEENGETRGRPGMTKKKYPAKDIGKTPRDRESGYSNENKGNAKQRKEMDAVCPRGERKKKGPTYRKGRGDPDGSGEGVGGGGKGGTGGKPVENKGWQGGGFHKFQRQARV